MGLKFTLAVSAAVLVGVSLIAWQGWRAEHGRQEPVPAVSADVEEELAQAPIEAEEEVAVRTPQTALAPPTQASAASGSGWTVRGVAYLYREMTPLPGIQVLLRLHAGLEAEGEPLLEQVVTTDEDGAFTWNLDAPGRDVTVSAVCSDPDHISGTASAAVPRRDEPPQDLRLLVQAASGYLVGVVRDEQGAPIPHARVQRTSTWESVSEDGSFRLPVAERNSSGYLTVDADGFTARRVVYDPPAAGQTRELTVELRPELVIFGRVRDENGKLLEGVEVSTFYLVGDKVHSRADGTFELGSLDPGRPVHSLIGRKDGMLLSSTEVQTQSRTRIEQDIVMHYGVRVEGRVTDAAGAPLAGVPLYIGFSPHAFDRVDAESDADGRFAFPSVARGKQTLVAQKDGLAPYREILEVPDDGVLLGGLKVVLEEPHHIGGRVTDAQGEPLPRVGVSVRWHGQHVRANGRTDADGRYRIDGLPGDSLSLTFYRDGYVRRQVPCELLDHEEMDVVMDRAGRVAGRVVDDATGEPVPSFTVRFVQPELEEGEQMLSGYSATWMREGHSFSGPDGYFDTGEDDLEPGTWIGIEIRAEGYAPTVDRHVQVVPDPDRDALVFRVQRGYRLTGLVVDAVTREPLEGAFVKRFTNFEPLREDDNDDTHGRIRTRTDREGRFLLERLSAEDMQLLIDHEGYAPLQSGVLDLVDGAADREHTFELVRGATVSGLLLDHEGRPVPAAAVMLAPRETDRARTLTGTTDEDGRFRFDSVLPGAWHASYSGKKGWNAAVFRTWPVVVPAEGDVEVTLRPAGTVHLTGHITSDTRDLPGNLRVTLEPLDGDEDTRPTRTAQAFVSGTMFDVHGLEPGRYRARVDHRDYATRMRWRGAAEVELEAGAAEATVWVAIEPVKTDD